MISGPSWTRRYGSGHRRLCARPGCGAPAAATLRFQPTQREAWLVDLDDSGSRTEGDLCARHAAGLVLPRGWQLHNSLAADRGGAAEPAPPVRRARGASIDRSRRRHTESTDEELPGLSAVADSDAEVDARGEPEGEPAGEPPSAPLVADATPEANDELAETLDAQTPLLRRAFRNVSLPENDS